VKGGRKLTDEGPALYAVVGKPVVYSRSPAMHNAAFRALRMPARYVRLAARSSEEALEKARSRGVRGLNVTSPFKEDFARHCDELEGPAKTLGAVNTVVFRDEKTYGFNTDGYGVAQALRSNGVSLKGKRAIVLGGGGAAKAAAHALVSEGARVVVANRTAQKAWKIAESLGCGHCTLRPEELKGAFKDAEIVVSAVGTTERIVPRSLLKRTMTILEANYTAQTALRRDAQQKGCRVIDGREWLLFQGARAFEIFTRRKAPLVPMRKALYEKSES